MAQSIEQIITSIRTDLANNNSKLANFSVFGNLYAIVSSFASVINTQDTKLDTLESNLYLSTATGNSLSRKVEDYGLQRKPGSRASGFVLVTNLQSTLPENTILVNPSTNLEYITKETVNPGVTNNADVFIPIEALGPGDNFNIQSSTPLYSSLFNNLNFVVGNRRNIATNIIEGDIINGTDGESDEDLRNRVNTFINSRAEGTLQAMQAALQRVPDIGRFYIVEHTPVTGYITVYIESKATQTKEQIRRIVESSKPAGIVVNIQTLQLRVISLSVTIKIAKRTGIPILRTTISNLVYNYISRIDAGGEISKDSISSLILNRPEVLSVAITNPTSNIVLRNSEIPSLNNISYKFITL